MDRVQSTFQQDKELVKSPINAELVIRLNEKPVLTLIDLKGNKASIEGDKVVEKAMKVALSKEKVESQIQKLGNTPYELSSITTILDEGVSLPISILNQMRRDCIELLNEERIKIKNRNYKSEKIAYKPTIAYKTIGKKIRAKVKNLEQLKAALECDIDSVYYEDIITLDKALEMGIKYNKKVIYSSPRIIRNKE